MTQNNEKNAVEEHGFLASKFGKVIMVILSVFLIFAGPTYVVYVLAMILKLNLIPSFSIGLVLFFIGMGLMWYLAKKKVIT